MNKKLFALILSVLMSLAIMNAVAEDECKHLKREPMEPQKATCTTAATAGGWQCAAEGCGYVLVQPTVVSPALGHKAYTAADEDYWDHLTAVDGEANCYNMATYYVDCKRCDGYAGTVTLYKHNYYEDDQYLLATCTEGAWVGQVCKTCGAKGEGKYISDPAHQWTVDKDATKGWKEATCTAAGFEPLQCVCGATSSRTVPALGHYMVQTDIKLDANDCGENAVVVWKCTKCNDYTENRPYYDEDGNPEYGSGSHDWKYVETVTMSCKTDGYELWECTKPNCHTKTEKRNVVAKDSTAHVIVWKEDKIPANCKNGTNGIAKYACAYNCAYTVSYKTVSYEDAHKYTIENVTKAPTCNKAGEKTVQCSVCNRTKTVEIPATGAHEYYEGYKRTTCDAPVYFGLVCWKCQDATYGELTKVRDVAGHEYELDGANSDMPWCGDSVGFEGVKAYKCKYCDDAYEVKYVVDHVLGETTREHVAPGCGVNGGYKATCTVCNTVVVVESKNADGSLKEPMPYDHTWVVKEQLKPTCKYNKTGWKLWECINDGCNAEKRTQWIPEAGMELHDYYFNGWTVQPSCYSDGEAGLKCGECGALKTVVVKGSDPYFECNGYVENFWHDYRAVAQKDANKCTDGYIDHKCINCGVTYREVDPAPEKHNYKETNTTPTCTKNASVGIICTVCEQAKPGCELTEVPGTALGHDKGDEYKGTDTRYQPKKATCLEPGYNWYYCKREGCANKTTPYQVSAKKLNHKYPAKGTQTAANCVNPLAYVYVCENGCGIDKVEPVLNADGEIAVPSLGGHKWEDSKVVAGTCAAKGYTEQKCVRCNATQKINETAIDPNNHDFTLKTTLRPATCTEPGVGIFQCTKCAAKPTKAQVIAAKHVANTTNGFMGTNPVATCQEKAYHLYECKYCGRANPVKVYFGNLADHNWIKEGGKVKEFVSDDGLTIYKKCSTANCGHTEVISYTSCVGGHTEEEIPAVEATCLKPGNTAGKKCSVCGYVIEKAVVIPALNHTEEVIPAVEATCLKVGSTAGKKCSVCDTVLVKPEEVPMLKHVEEIIVALAPTCTTPGSTAGKMCSVCGTITVDPVAVPATGHTFKDGACVDCGAADPDFIPDHTHSYKKSYKFNADFTKRVVTYTCECGHTYSEEEDF